MENGKRNVKRRIIYKNDLLSEELKTEIKHLPRNHKIIQKNIKDSNDNLYSVVTPIDNMDLF